MSIASIVHPWIAKGKTEKFHFTNNPISKNSFVNISLTCLLPSVKPGYYHLIIFSVTSSVASSEMELPMTPAVLGMSREFEITEGKRILHLSIPGCALTISFVHPERHFL